MTILNVHAGSLPSFSLRLKQNEDLPSLRQRVAKKIRLQLEDGIPMVLRYRSKQNLYSLEDQDDLDIFHERLANAPEAHLYVESPEIPTNGSPQFHDDHADGPNLPHLDDSTLVARSAARGKTGAVSIHRVQPAPVTSLDEFTEAGGVSGGGRDSILYPPPREAAPMPGYSKPKVPEPNHHSDATSVHTSKTGRSGKTAGAASATGSVPQHKIAFQEFHAQLGVRLLKGSIGPVQDVPMMLKSGYRHVYVSRNFALTHGFIPKDTTPGTYGFNGITNLGKWPIQIGSKAVSLTVMLAEDSYFPVTLGRSFMEKRGVRTDPIDMTAVTFMDNGERADVEVVVVRDEKGEPVNIS
ncbi:hypothetical protein OC846_002070 [Tilletia horrida]|uniref:Uncharacterized protein n=1 Tax=Tilletia horrida TaxID=155126 RepID=A0AAN6GSY2_9BASI|nr:hypothetical protein OC845_004416 [Tilletia horrida]KAK0554498.1 hypothetical protein OC846_002070 [Tilletia horrida]KAK0568092.1 hypothetical protein OC861_002257 [Tilletia horrida]